MFIVYIVLQLLMLHAVVSVPVSARSKAWVCGLSLVGVAGSNAAGGGGKDVWLLCVLCAVW